MVIFIEQWKREHPAGVSLCALRFWCPRWWSRLACNCRR